MVFAHITQETAVSLLPSAVALVGVGFVLGVYGVFRMVKRGRI
jgi:hypothetical protein